MGCLRVAGGFMDPVAAKIRIGRILANASMQPASLPPRAVLIVRRLSDPLPGVLCINSSDVEPLARWQRGVTASLERFAAAAGRPALGPVPSDAESVVFQDRSQMLACLATDWCDGSAILHWWWRSLFRATDVTSAVAREWLTSIEYVPAAFAKLAQKGNAIKFAGSLPDSAVSRLLDEITRNFGLADLRSSLSHSKIERQPLTTGLSDQSKPSRSNLAEPLSSREITELRTRLAPEAFAPRLKADARLLLVAALMLERAPTVLRQHSFAGRLMASLLATGTTEGIDIPTVIERSQRELAFAIEKPTANERRRTEPLMRHLHGGDETHTRGLAGPSDDKYPADRVQKDGLPARVENQRQPQPDGVAPRRWRAEVDAEDGKSVVPRFETSTGIGLNRAGEELRAIPFQQPDVTAASIEVAVETKLGGVFYLINAALALNLYGDFTKPLEPGIELSIWDFLALIGRELIGKRIEFEPIWPLLAKLAGRDESERPGARFKPPGEWRMPPDWLNAFPELGEWSYQTRRGRLIVRHPAGFDVLDVKLGSRFRMKNIEARLASETGRHPNEGFKGRRFVQGGIRRRKRERSLDRWTRWIADYLRVRVARSLGIGSADELTTMLFAPAARVEVNPARLDVFFSLAELPVEVRLSGLDRNPGWVPAAGRYIVFHFD